MKTNQNYSKAILIALLFMAMLKTQAQSVSYTVTYDDPTDVNNLFIIASPFYCEANAVGNGANIGFLFQGNYNLGKRLAFEASYANAYLDIMARGGKTATGTTKILSKHKNIEAGAAFFLGSKIKKKKVKITLSSSQSSSSYIEIPASVHAQSGFRGGFLYYNYAIQADGKDYFTGKNPNTGKDTSLSVFDYHGIATNMNVGGTYLGLIRRKTVDISLYAKGYGTKGASKIGEVYFDILLAPVIKYSDVKVSQIASSGSPFGGNIKPASDPILYKLSNTPSKFIGWRFGYQYTTLGNVGFQARMEVGQKPGWGVKSGFYLNASFALSFGMKAKPTPPAK